MYDLYGSSKTPMAEFRVTAGNRYRFRIVSGTCLACPFRITFQNHRPLVISVDDNPIEPVQVDSVVLSAGEKKLLPSKVNISQVIVGNKITFIQWRLQKGSMAPPPSQEQNLIDKFGLFG